MSGSTEYTGPRPTIRGWKIIATQQFTFSHFGSSPPLTFSLVSSPAVSVASVSSPCCSNANTEILTKKTLWFYQCTSKTRLYQASGSWEENGWRDNPDLKSGPKTVMQHLKGSIFNPNVQSSWPGFCFDLQGVVGNRLKRVKRRFCSYFLFYM